MWTGIGSFLNICFSLFLVISPFNALAEDVTFEATVNTNKISLQDMLELTLTIHGAKSDVSMIALPPIDGFDARFVGPATKYTIVNGVSSSERSFIYDLFPSKVGHYQIPVISRTIGGVTYKTSPINIEVVDKPTDPSSSNVSDESAQQNINDRVFMKAFVEPKEVYVGEKTPLVMDVFVNGLSLQLASAPYLTPDGFIADTTANMQRTKEVINGINYDSLKFNTNIYPTHPGHLNVGPFQAQGELVYRVKQNNDILGEFFASTQNKPITLTAPVISLNVLPLPTEGQPQNFSGAVGQYDFKASIGPLTVKVGDPLTLHMMITGQGRFKDLAVPVFNDSRFKTYDPQTKEDENSKSVEQVIIPTDKSINEIPALSFSYFDSQEKKYKTIIQGPFPVKVLAQTAGEEFKAYGFIDKTKSSGDNPFVFKAEGFKGFVKQIFMHLVAMIKNLWFWFFVLVLGVLGFGIYIWREFQNRLQNDIAFSRRWKADSKAKGLLKDTQGHLQKNNSKEFYRSLYKTLNDYLADKMHVPLAGLNWSMIEFYLKEHSIDPIKLQIIKDLLEHCDLVRFASYSMTLEQMTKDFEQLQDLMNYLPKILK